MKRPQAGFADVEKNELVLLVGTKGAGKSTFIDRFFADVLPSSIRDDCVIVRIDLSKSGNPPSVTKWLDEHFLASAEKAAYPTGSPSYDELQGMFFGEYQRWRQGHAKYLYKTNKTQFKIEFGIHVEAYRRDRPHDYIKILLKRVVHGHSKVPCLVFDKPKAVAGTPRTPSLIRDMIPGFSAGAAGLEVEIAAII